MSVDLVEKLNTGLEKISKMHYVMIQNLEKEKNKVIETGSSLFALFLHSLSYAYIYPSTNFICPHIQMRNFYR